MGAQIFRRMESLAPAGPWRRAGAGFVAIALAAAGCSGSGPTASTAPAAITQHGQQCTICRLENPGDNAACYAVCMERIEDFSAGQGAAHP
jgi:hypothetical protein